MKVHLIALLWLCGFFIAGSTNPYMPFANLIGAFIITEQQYIEHYLPILQKLPLNIINEFLTPQERTLVCFCRENAFCHRNIVVNYFMHLYPNNVVYGGFRK